jgi:hypothetical protein
MPDRPDIPEEAVENLAAELWKWSGRTRWETALPIEKAPVIATARSMVSNVADPLRNQGAEEERERLKGEFKKRMAALDLNEPRAREKRNWWKQALAAVTPAPSEPEEGSK